MKKIKIKGRELVQFGDWIDLYAAEQVTLEKGDYKQISLGVAMKLPRGYEAHILPRSSTFRRHGILLVNGCGIIDNNYCGNNDIWTFPAYATRDTVIYKGDRIAQFRIVKSQPRIKFVFVDKLKGKNRGGLGSTGR